MRYKYVCFRTAVTGERRDGDMEEEEEEGGNKKLCQTGKTQRNTTINEDAASTGYAGRNNTSPDGSNKGHLHHQHHTPVYA